MSRRRIGYNRVIAKKIKSSLEEPDARNSFVDVCNHIVEKDLTWRYLVQPRADENVTMFLNDFRQKGDFYVGRFVRLRHEDLITFEANNRNFEPLSLGEGSSLSEIMHFVYSPTLRLLSVDTGRSIPGLLDLFKYLNKKQLEQGYIYDAIKLDSNIIGHPDVISELRKHNSARTLTVMYDDGHAIDTSDPANIRAGIGSLSGIGKMTQVYYGIKRGRKRDDVISTTDLIQKIEANEFKVGAFGNVSAELATEYGNITLRLFGDKIKEYIDVPQGYYRNPEPIYERIIASINDNHGILQDAYEDD